MLAIPRSAAALALLAALSLGCHDVHFEPHQDTGEIAIHDDLFAVSVVDDEVAYAAGYWGAIYKTTDGGGTWEKSDSGTKRLLYDVSMADRERGWVVGQQGTILRTEDGGETWVPQENPKKEQGVHLFGLHAIDVNTAWIVGEWGTRLFTDDGGKSWQDFSLTIDETHPMFVWLAPVEQERVRRGEKVFEDVTLNDVTCLEGSHRCWIAGEFGYIFRSETDGRGWERAEIQSETKFAPVPLEYNVITIPEEDRERLREFANSILDQQHLNVEIQAYASPREIEEFGRNPEEPFELFEILEARVQDARTSIEAAGILGDRIRTRAMPPWDYEDFIEDDPEFLERYFEGRTAEQPKVEVGVAQNPFLFSVRFRDADHGMISGLGGVMLVSDDGGHTWSYERTDRKQAYFAVEPLDERAIAIGEKGLIRVSQDGGRTWEPPGAGFPNVFTFMRDIDFADGDGVGYIVGQRGMILRSQDAGASWSQVLPEEVMEGPDLRI